MGATKLPNGKWRARYQHNKQKYNVGVFRTRKEALEQEDLHRERLRNVFADTVTKEQERSVLENFMENEKQYEKTSFRERVKSLFR